MGIYSMGTNSVYQIWQIGKTECFASISLEGLTREILAKTSCLHPVLTLRIPVMYRAHASLCEKLNCELPVKTALVFNSLESSHTFSLSHTTLTNKSHLKYRVYKIKQNYNKIWHEIKVNYNFTIFRFGYSMAKPLKQTLDLNVSLEAVAKLTHT